MSKKKGHTGILRSAFAVARKELIEGFRDRQTLIYTFALPVCMYPALFWVMVQGVLVVQGQKGARNVTVGVTASADLGAEPLQLAKEALRIEELPVGTKDDGTPTPARQTGLVSVVDIDLGPDASDESLRRLLEEGDQNLDAIVTIPGPLDSDDSVRVFYDSTASKSEIARERVEKAMRSWADELRSKKAEVLGVDPIALDPVKIRTRGVAEKKDEGALVLSLMLPILLVVMTVLGAFFPAVDLTAGEKERGAAETTMLLPVPRTGVHLGKILAVCASSMIATALNLLALALSAGHLLSQLAGATKESIPVELPLGALFQVLPLAVLFAFFVSAALTGFASLAASFKEGQALLGPVQMLFIFPAMAATLPGMTLDPMTACIPVVNVALAFRALLVGDAQLVPLLICGAALIVFALGAIWFSVRLRSNEKVALSGETISLGGLIGLLKSK